MRNLTLALGPVLVSRKFTPMKFYRTALMVAAASGLTAVTALAQTHANRDQSSTQAAVSARGPSVMGFDVSKTKHVFEKTADGGVQSVVIREPSCADQIPLIQTHLHHLAMKIQAGDWSNQEAIHSPSMPGLATLKAAKIGTVKSEYRGLPDGGQVVLSSADPALRKAIHDLFDAQLADHGADATSGEHNHHMDH